MDATPPVHFGFTLQLSRVPAFWTPDSVQVTVEVVARAGAAIIMMNEQNTEEPRRDDQTKIFNNNNNEP